VISKRPRDADATRAILLDAATAVFSEHGFAGARVDEIARRAGVNKALIYAYYGHKGGLYRAVLSSRLATPPSSASLGPELDPLQRLEEVVREYFRVPLEDRAVARLLAWDLLSAGRRPKALVEVARPALDLIVALARRARDSGALRDGVDPTLFRRAVVALALGYSLHHPVMELGRTQSGLLRTDEEFVEYACRLLLKSGRDRAGAARRRSTR
jgi:TetR/AcrR family transcriptional regulator